MPIKLYVSLICTFFWYVNRGELKKSTTPLLKCEESLNCAISQIISITGTLHIDKQGKYQEKKGKIAVNFFTPNLQPTTSWFTEVSLPNLVDAAARNDNGWC